MAGPGVELATAWVRLVPSMDGVSDNITKALAPGVKQAEKSGEKIGEGLGKGISAKQAAIMGAIGGAVATVADRALNAVTDLFGEAVAASDATDKFVQTLSFAGLDTKGIEKAKREAREYADQTVYDLTTIQNTTAQLAANGVKDYVELTKAAGNLNAVAGGNAETYKSVAMVLTQTAGAGKLTTENWNQLANAIPGASGRLMDALLEAGAYTGNFRDAMAAGEITAEEFNQALLTLGSEPVAVEAATSVTTMEGAVGNLAASITGLLADAFTAIKPIITPFISGLADLISNSELFIPLISGIGAAIFVALIPSIWAAVTATWAWTAALLANPITWIVLGIGLLVAALVALVMNWDSVVAWITDIWDGFIGWVTGIIDGFVGWWNGMWADVSRGWNDFWNNVVNGAKLALNLVSSIILTVVRGIQTWWENTWNGISSFFRNVWNGIVAVVQTVGGAFSNVFNGIRSVAVTVFNALVGIVKAPINGIIGLVNGAIRGLNSIRVSIPDWVPFIGGQTFGVSLPTIPYLAAGATILPRPGGTLAVLAEAGRPESVVDTGLMNRALEEGLAGNKQQGVVVQGPLVQIDEMVVDSDQRVDEVAKALWERASRATRASGQVDLGGAVTA